MCEGGILAPVRVVLWIHMQRTTHTKQGRTADAMAGVLGGVDSAATSLGFPIRNMHTISELGHTGDVIACIHALKAALDR
jgi:putative aminopeptidase FrvX